MMTPKAPFYLLGFLVLLSVCGLLTTQAEFVPASSMKSTEYTTDQLESMKSSSEHHAFQAEVSQLLDILVNSLYSNRDVFLRELISNGSDALGKIRFQSLTDSSVLATKSDLGLYIKADRRANTLHIIDTGIGMTHAELVENLGRIAKSGTKEFLKAINNQDGDSSSLIGKFGVGFYSAFLVADTVRVTSKSNDDPTQWVWESTADGSFTITPDPHGNTLGRGTQVSLLLKSGMDEYLDEDNLENLIHRYSEFISFPIYLWTTHEEERVIPRPAKQQDEAGFEVDEHEEGEDDEDDEDEDDVQVIDVWAWERINAVAPIWTRDPSEVTEEQYNKFYQSLSLEIEPPLAHTHFTAEGDVNFKSILFIPSSGADYAVGSIRNRGKPLRLFVKRVFITDTLDELMPKYLPFINGVVDSDDLDLNVSREVLQQSKALSMISKKLVRKAIAMFQEMAQDEPEKYEKFWSQFGTHIKWGYLEDKQNKNRLEKLLRFQSSHESGLTGLEAYVERMREGQDQIFFLSGQDLAALKASPLLEKITNRGYEVLFLTEPIDEYIAQTLLRFGDYPLTNIAKEGLKLGDEPEIDLEALNEKFAPLISFLKTSLGFKRVSNVILSDRLESVPAALVSGQFGWTANMERIARAQALTDKSGIAPNRARRILELNPLHPTIEGFLHTLNSFDETDPQLADNAFLLYHSALLTSGFDLDEPLELSQQLHRVLASSLAQNEESQ